MDRKLPATALDLAISCGRQNASSMHIHFIAVVEGAVDFERLRKAVFLSLEAEPVLATRFVSHPLRPYWEPQPALSREDFRERYCCVLESDDLDTALFSFLPEPLDPVSDPLVQVRLIRKAGHPQQIVAVKLCHLVGDAGGLLSYAQQLIRVYARLATEPDYKPAANWRSRGFDQITSQFSLKEKLQIVRSTVQALRRREAVRRRYEFPNAPAPREQRMYLRLELLPSRVQALKSYGRRNGATLNLVLLAAYYRAICAVIPVSGSGVLPVMSTVDLRRYVPKEERARMPLCNLSGVTTLYIGERATTFPETLTQMVEQMKERKGDYLGLLMVPLVLALYRGLPFLAGQRIAANDFAKMRKNRTSVPALTNAGEILPEDFEFGDVTLVNSYGVASVMYAPTFATSVTEFRKTVTLCTGFCQTLIPRATVEAIFDHMDRELAELAEQHQSASTASRTKKSLEVLNDG
jgi:NRPS condensation-like uncharacterized protein